MEETTNETSEKTREKGDSIVDSRREKWVAGLLRSKKVVALLLKFLKTIDMKEKEEAREKKLE